jgi:twitching motility protein PilT
MFTQIEDINNHVPRQIDQLLYRTLALGASDLHLAARTPAWVTLHGETQLMMDKQIDGRLLATILEELAGPAQWDRFKRRKRLDFAMPAAVTVPLSLFDRRRLAARRLPRYPHRSRLRRPRRPGVIETFLKYQAGLFLFVGVTGSGKSTLQASMVKKKKDIDAHKIITVEEPIEYLHTHGKSMIVQREVGPDVDSFAIGVQDAMREAPDMILIGEMRDPETVSAALSAASSGHLVFSTLHAESTADAPTRILDGTPVGRIQEVRAQLSRSLKGVVYQRLLPVIGGGRRVAATEVLLMNPAISNMIRNNELDGIASQLNDKDSGSIPLEVSLAKLVMDGVVMESVATRAELRKDSVRDQIRSGRRAA